MSEAEAGLETLARAARQRMAQLTQIAAAPQAAAEHDRDGLMAVFRDVLLQQGAAADLLRMLTLQERALAAVLSAADQRTVWATLPHVRQAWDALAAATGAEDEDGEEESGGEAAAFGSADGAEPEHAAVPQQTHAQVRLAPHTLPWPSSVARLPTFGCGTARPLHVAQGAGVADGAPKQGVVLFRWSTNYKLQTCLLLPPPPPTPEGLTGSDAQRDAPPQPPSAHNQQASPVGATSSGGAGLPPSPRGEEREVPYHEGLERQLPERFKVKFLAWSTATDLPPAPPLPPASFLFLQVGLRLAACVTVAVLEHTAWRHALQHVGPH